MRPSLAACVILGLALPANADAQATSEHRHASAPIRAGGREPVASRQVQRQQDQGVPGQAPFNNQLRKFSDPLNANGAK